MEATESGSVFFVSLGCDKNLVDSEFMLGTLKEHGWVITNDELKADAIVVNTCCFINDAKEESINTILEMAEYKKTGKCRALLVTGCLAQRYTQEIRREIPEVDAVLGIHSYDELIHAIKEVTDGKTYESFCTFEERMQKNAADVGHAHPKRSITTGGHYAYLKIAEGCDKHCTYCIIPSVRGSYRSVPIEELLYQASQLAKAGVKELILVAQETTLYGTDLYGEKSLPKLLDELNKVEGLCWIRILYCYPEEIDDSLIQAIKRNGKVCHYLDMPIQHADNEILRRMGRRTSSQDIQKTVEKLRLEIPDICLRTTVICGFPGETQAQHEELMEFINEIEFDRLGAFIYSPEEGTPAEKFPEQVSEEQKLNWQEEVMELEQEIIFDKTASMKDQIIWAFVEGKLADENIYAARTYRDAPDIDGYVFIANADRELMTGDFVKVRVTGALDYDLTAECLP